MPAEWVAVASFSQPVEAHLARTKLESEGIPCVVGDEHLVRVDWFLSNAVGGVKVMVPRSEAEHARDVLRPRPRLVVVAERGAPSDGEMICPRCRCDDVYYRRYSRRVAGVFMLLLGFLIPWRDSRWTCTRCGYEWKES
jgi:DNA-directed RNA polymerase subunit M/transcription elongation factor TFIIS